MRGCKRALIGLGIVAGAALFYDYGSMITWDGEFPLIVRLEPDPPDLLQLVWGAPMSQPEWAEEVMLDTASADRELREVANFRSPFEVIVHCSGQTTGFGRSRWYAQYRVLVLRVEYADGRRETRLVEIPDGRLVREVNIRWERSVAPNQALHPTAAATRFFGFQHLISGRRG